MFTGDKEKNEKFVSGKRGMRSDVLGLEFWGTRIFEAALEWSWRKLRWFYGSSHIDGKFTWKGVRVCDEGKNYCYK